jgi:catalase
MLVADNQNRLAAWPRDLVLTQDFHPAEKLACQNGERNPKHAKGSAASANLTATDNVSRHRTFKSRTQIGKKTEAFLRAAVGPSFVVAAAAVVAITLSLVPAPDRPVFLAGPLSGHSLLHFPR